MFQIYIKFYCNNLVKEYLVGYKKSWLLKYSCPTELYLDKIKQKKVWEGMPFYSPEEEKLYQNVTTELSINRRLSLGLPIKQSEFKILNK